MSVSAARTRSWHTRWRNKLLPLSLRIDFRTVPYAHIPVTVCLRRQGAAGQPAPPPFASCTRARRGRCCSRPDRVGYYLDRRCLDQSLKSSWKMPLLITFPTFSPPQALKMVGSFVGGGARKKVAGTLQNCKKMRPITITLESSAPSRSSLFTASSASNRPPQQPTPPRRNRLHHHTAKPTAAIPPAFAAFAIAIAALSPPSASPLPPLPPLPRRHHRNRYRRRRRQARRRRPHRPHLTRPRPRCARHHSARHCRPRHRRPRRHLTRHAPPPPHPPPSSPFTS